MMYLWIFLLTVVSSTIGAVVGLVLYNWVPLVREALSLYKLQKRLEKEGSSAWDNAPTYEDHENRKPVGPVKVHINPGDNYIPRKMP